MKLNIRNLSFLVMAFLVCLIAYFFGVFNFVSTKYVTPEPELEKSDTFIGKFSFVPTRNNASGLMIKFIRNLYALELTENELEMKIHYTDTQGQDTEYSKIIPMTQIKNGNQKIIFPELLANSKNQKVTVTFITKYPMKNPDVLILSNQSYNPDPGLNTAQRVMYKVRVTEIIGEIWQSYYGRDPKFTVFYLTVSSILATLALSLFLLEFTGQENRLKLGPNQ